MAVNYLNRFFSASREGQSALQRIIDMYGNSYKTGQERTALAAAESSLARSGLGGTTLNSAVGSTLAAQFEDIRKSRLADALKNMASYVQNDASTLANLHNATAQQPIFKRTYGKSYGASSFPDMFSITGGGSSGGGSSPLASAITNVGGGYLGHAPADYWSAFKPKSMDSPRQQTWSDEELRAENIRMGNIR